jgi:hypothetical protein
VQASRYAAARYPDQVQRVTPDGGTYRISNPDRFTAEIRFYESCLRAKGYTRPGWHQHRHHPQMRIVDLPSAGDAGDLVICPHSRAASLHSV